MSDRWVLSHDPREGEWPEPMDLCPHNVDLASADCGICAHEAIVQSMANMADEIALGESV